MIRCESGVIPTMKSTQRHEAEQFSRLHRGNEILILPNAWDAASAKLFEQAGAKAIGTTSSGVAASHGYPDGSHVPRELTLGTVRDITRTVRVPLTVDIEAGYGETVDEVSATAQAVLAAGAVGINIEDGRDEPAVLVEKIRAICRAAQDTDVPLFINARTDVYLLGLGGGDPGAQLAETIRRAGMYDSAGADGIFVPGLTAPEDIAALHRETALPINVLVRPGMASPEELRRHGAARVSVGGGPMRATMALTRRIADALLNQGEYSHFLDDTIPYAELNAMFGDTHS